jgi:hypothetical protein
MTDSGMPKRSSKPKKAPAFDPNTIASRIVEQATAEEPSEPEVEATPEEPTKNPAAVALGRMGGLKGGAARAKSLTKKRRAEIAKKAAKTRWAKK